MRRFCLLTFTVTSLAHSLNIRAEPKSALNDGFASDSGVRIYENLKQDVELGIHHPSSIQAAAGVMVASKRAALAYLSSHSSTGMTGMTGGTGGFDYPSFSKDIDTQSEKTLVRLFDTTESALEATRSDVLGRHGLGSAGAATGATGSEATDSSSTGSAMTGNEELKSTTDATGATAGAAGATGAAEEESTGAGAATQETGGTGSGSTKGGKHGNTKEQEQNEYSI